MLASRLNTVKVHAMKPILFKFLVNPSISAQVEQYKFDKVLVSGEIFAIKQQFKNA